MIRIHKTSWHTMLFLALWAYRMSVKSTTGFTPFWSIYGLEAILPIECEIPSLKLVRRTPTEHFCRRRTSVVSHVIRRNSMRCYPSHRSPEETC
jgi:hypothetical protein